MIRYLQHWAAAVIDVVIWIVALALVAGATVVGLLWVRDTIARIQRWRQHRRSQRWLTEVTARVRRPRPASPHRRRAS